MSDMRGNPHYQNGIDQIEQVEDLTVQEQIQADATLALAWEQRTANLIAAFTSPGGQAIVGQDLAANIALGKHIAERLGL